MGAETKIEWCDATLNLWWGCTKVSDGCKFCYAEQLSDQRYHKGAWGPGGVRTEVKSWRSTLNKISKRAKAEGRRLRVFCQSMSDTFEGPETCGGLRSANFDLMNRLRHELYAAIDEHPELDFLLLTKRPDNVMKQVPQRWLRDGIPTNLWIGTSVEDQKTADERIPHLLAIPAAVRFLSCEPLLGPVKIERYFGNLLMVDEREGWKRGYHFESGKDESGIHWVICGGESGSHARPMHSDWARSLRDQCQAAGVPFFFKQWGEWSPDKGLTGGFITRSGREVNADGSSAPARHSFGPMEETVYRVGKHRAGRLLDGRTWDEFPVVAS